MCRKLNIHLYVEYESATVGVLCAVYELSIKTKRPREFPRLRPEGPKIEPKYMGWDYLGTGQLDPLHQQRGPGERCKLIQRDQGQSPGRSTIFVYSEVSKLRYFG